MISGKVNTRRMKLLEMNPAPYNPRKISNDAFEGLGSSIDRFGLLSLIIWNEQTGNIVGGHQRYKKLVEDGESETEVVVVNLDHDAEVALNIVLNSPHVRGDFTQEVVGLLGRVEAQIGSAFNDLGLSDLHLHMKRIKFGKEGKNPKSPADNPTPPKEDDLSGEAIVSCPRCGSMFKFEDQEVIYNAIESAKKDINEVDG